MIVIFFARFRFLYYTFRVIQIFRICLKIIPGILITTYRLSINQFKETDLMKKITFPNADQKTNVMNFMIKWQLPIQEVF